MILIPILDAIDRNGSFEAAACELHKVRSALSYTIRKFEKNLDVQIFERSGRRALFTSTGRMLLDQGRQLLRSKLQLENNINLAASGWESVLGIVYDEKISLKPLLNLIARFKEECPPVHLELYSEILGGCAERINNNTDIAIGMTFALPTSSDFHLHPIGLSHFVFAIASHHPLAKIKGIITHEMVKKYPLIVARDSSSNGYSSISGLFSDSCRMTVSSLEVKKQAQIEGLGVGFLPLNHIMEEVKNKKLIIMETDLLKPVSTTYIAWNKKKRGKALKWFIKNMKSKKFIEEILK